MSFSPLTTKLFIPPVRPGAVARPRLVQKLRAGMGHPGSFALLSGPAGFGKTTLISDFVAQIREAGGQPARAAAWLSLDEGDNEPNRFWSYLIHACQSALGEGGETALALLRAPQPMPDEAIPGLLINDLAVQERALVLVLDDLHAIQNPSILAGLLFLVDHLPPNLYLIVSTRADPPWPLARFRARGQLVEIRAQDLRFNLEEAGAFLSHTMGLPLPAPALAALEERTEGWIAGLQLAAISMQGREDAGAFIQDFTGSHVYVAEYLMDEVLRQQPAETQSFLLQTAVLSRLNGALCQAVTGCADGENVLRTLLRSNIFISPLDDEGRWFRYHHLFADLLNARLRNSRSKDEIAALHRRAAGWHEQNGMVAEAVEHYLAAADYTGAARVVEAAALPMILQAHVRTVESWLQAIPAGYMENSPRINLAYAWMNLLRGMPRLAMPFIERLRAYFSAPEASTGDPSLRVEWLALQAELLIAQGRPRESRELAVQAHRLLPEVDPNIRGMAYTTLAKAYQQTFDYDRAAEIYQMIVQDARRAGDIIFEVLGASGEAQMVLKQGRLRRTAEIARECIRRVELSGKKVPFSATLFGELGQVHYHWGQFDQAQESFRRSAEISGKSGYSDPEIYFHLMLSKIRQIEGDLSGAVDEMEQARRLASILPPAMIQENVVAQQVWVELATGRPEEAERLLAARGFRFGEDFTVPELAPGAPIALEAGLLYNSALRVLLYHAAAGLDASAGRRGIELAERVVEGELQGQDLPAALETLLLLSQLHAAAGETRQSHAAAARAVALAEPEGFISPFVEEGQPVAKILSDLLRSGPPEDARPEAVRQILAAFPAGPGQEQATARPAAAEGARAGLVEPLSAREMEVLRCIASGDSNQAIAEKLFITVSAVKKHTGNIYGKLSVSSRTQAVARARQLGLLPADG